MKKLTAGIFATILGLTAVDAFAAVPATKTAVATTNYVAGALDAAKSYTDSAVANKAAQADLNALGDRVTTAEGEIDTLQETVGTLSSASGNYADKETVNGINTRLGTAEGEIDALQAADLTINEELAKKATVETVNGIDTRVTTAEGEIDALQEAVADKADASALTNYVLWTDVDNDFTQEGIQ